VLIYFFYATNPPLRLVKVLSNQNSRWQLSFALSTDKRQEILVFPISWFPDTWEDDRCNAALVQQLVSLRDWHGRKTQTEHKDHHYSGWKEVLLWWWDHLHKTQMHEIQNKDYYHNKKILTESNGFVIWGTWRTLYKVKVRFGVCNMVCTILDIKMPLSLSYLDIAAIN